MTKAIQQQDNSYSANDNRYSTSGQ